MPNSIGSRIRKLRRARNLTQKQLADEAGLYHTTISELELGITVPGIPTLEKLADALGVKLADLFIPPSQDRKA